MSENKYEVKEENQNAREEENRKPENQEQENNAQESKNQQIKEMGQAVLNGNSRNHKVELLTIIGEVEGHESAPSHSKTTKYEHILPKLAIIEDDEEIEGLLILLNTVGGDVEAGLAIAEMIASLSIPTVSLVLGGGHSIRVPMAVSADYSFVVPSATMVIHPVPFQWYVYRSGADIPEYGKNPGPDHYLYFRPFPYDTEETGGADAGYLPAGKRCGNHAGRS